MPGRPRGGPGGSRVLHGLARRDAASGVPVARGT